MSNLVVLHHLGDAAYSTGTLGSTDGGKNPGPRRRHERDQNIRKVQQLLGRQRWANEHDLYAGLNPDQLGARKLARIMKKCKLLDAR